MGSTAPTGRHGFAYQPALDGLRGVAVVAVILYHLDYSWMSGGFLGVDTFFVLSGYLITSLLLAEYDTTESVSLRDFWIRRAKRLLPAALLPVVVAVALLRPDGCRSLPVRPRRSRSSVARPPREYRSGGVDSQSGVRLSWASRCPVKVRCGAGPSLPRRLECRRGADCSGGGVPII